MSTIIPQPRPLQGIRDYMQPSDYDKGFLQLLEELRPLSKDDPSMTREEFENQFAMTPKIDNQSSIYVIEDPITSSIVASATLLIEYKFLRGGSKVGHIEDVVVSSTHRKSGYGKLLIDFLINLAKEQGCYKTILDCSPELEKFYEKCDMKKHGIQMAKYYS